MRKTILAASLCLAPLAVSTMTASAKTVECYCTDRTGARVELGQTTCLDINGRQFTARCEMSLNTPMWRDTGTGCFTS